MTTTHKQMTAHIRKLLKIRKIKARCKMFTACGQDYIQVVAPTYDSRFSAEEIREFAFIAKCNGLTGAQRSVIDPDHESRLTGKQQWNFEFHAN